MISWDAVGNITSSKPRTNNAIETIKDSQLAREIEAALPRELSREQQLALVRAYVKDNFCLLYTSMWRGMLMQGRSYTPILRKRVSLLNCTESIQPC